ncbi:hypothetical protein [Microbulbifer sp. 2205BS26-8]|uniref:hypothetical protein n=1 Tax=Microbulbifer sp. 2205BS26-8 TaxID=3064386 RepID=UPI00273D82CC|nr:hypothetical protein [Microbulbifer sp. 2205BS26-8]MDP5209851.1 hypothetical protein [Microbulbifer sp. 2205BS26-8]
MDIDLAEVTKSISKFFLSLRDVCFKKYNYLLIYAVLCFIAGWFMVPSEIEACILESYNSGSYSSRAEWVEYIDYIFVAWFFVGAMLWIIGPVIFIKQVDSNKKGIGKVLFIGYIFFILPLIYQYFWVCGHW